MSLRLRTLTALISLLACAGCAKPTPRPAPKGEARAEVKQPRVRDVGPWRAEVALDAGVALNGCAIGDVLPERSGNELVCVGSQGEVFVVWRVGEAWKHKLLLRCEGELVQVAIGDVDPSREGVEIVVVGNRSGSEDASAPGTARLVYRAGELWKQEEMLDDPRLLHMVQVVGQSVLLAGYSQEVHLVERREGRWVSASVAKLPGPAKASAVFADGWAIACQDGSLSHLVPKGAGWSTTLLDKRGAGRARVAAYRDHLLVADDDGTLALVPGASPGLPAGLTGQTRVEVYRAKSKLRGAVLADLDPDVPGLELATTTGEGALVTLSHVDGRWTARDLVEDTHTLHHLAHGELGGLERPVLAAPSRSGRLYVAWRR